MTPSTTDDTTSSEESTDPEELFATRYVSSEDYHAWYCEFDEGEFEDYVFALILVESGGGAFSLANKVTGESVDSFAGVWEATEQDLTLINEEEQLGVEVYDYTFYTATIWDGAMSVYDDSSQDPTFLCALGDQDGNAVEQ